MKRSFLARCFFLIIFVLLTGCSSGGNSPVVAPDANQNTSGNSQNEITPAISEFSLPVSDIDYDSSGHSLLGVWNVTFDTENLTAEIELDRLTAGHWNVTGYIPTPVIHINSYNSGTGIVDVDFTISHPFGFNGYDVRLIIYTDSIGHMLTNADDWTSLYDIAGGLPINPFKAYAKGNPNRTFYGLTQETENLLIYLPGLNPNVTFAVDASYPTNCAEPYEMSGFTQDVLGHTIGDDAHVQVDVFDWQDNISSVSLYCPAITGTTLVQFTHATGNTWERILVNNTGASSGIYTGYMLAGSSGFILYDRVTIEVAGGFAPVAVCSMDPSPAKHGRTVHFIDSGSYTLEPGSYITTYKWDPDISDGVNYVYEYDEPDAIYHIYNNITHDPILVTARLRVEDNLGGWDECDYELIVYPNTRPVAVSSVIPDTIPGGAVVTFVDIDSYDPDSDDSISIYKWDPDIYDGINFIYVSAAPNQFSHLYENTGPGNAYFAARLMVEDRFDGWDIEDKLITVTPNYPPVPVGEADFNPAQNRVPVNFIDEESYDEDLDGYITEYAWDFDYKNDIFTVDSVSDLPNQASHTYTNITFFQKHYDVALRVTDDNGVARMMTFDLAVNSNTNPVAVGFTVPAIGVVSGQPVTFYASDSYDNDPGDSIVLVLWDFDYKEGFPFSPDWSSEDVNEGAETVFYNTGGIAITVISQLRVYDQDTFQGVVNVSLKVSPAP